MKQIPLSKFGKNRGKYFTLVDDEDFDWLNGFHWHVEYHNKDCPALYAVTTGPVKNGPKIKMHNLIMGLSDHSLLVDHVDHNGLNNQRSNLRTCTPSENMKNRTSSKNGTSKFLGVFLVTVKNRQGKIFHYWKSQITINKKPCYGKHFSVLKYGSGQAEIMAAKHYDEIAKTHHGEFANLNYKK